MLTIVHKLEDLDFTKDGVIIDLSDAGEAGYQFGKGPDELMKHKKTIYDALYIDDGGIGLRNAYQNMFPERKRTLLLGCPMRSHDLNVLLTTESCYGCDTMRSKLQYMLEYFTKERGWNVQVLVSRVPNEVHKAVHKLKNKEVKMVI